MSSGSFSYVFLKEEVCLDIDDPIAELPQNEQGGFLTIYEDHVVE